VHAQSLARGHEKVGPPTHNDGSTSTCDRVDDQTDSTRIVRGDDPLTWGSVAEKGLDGIAPPFIEYDVGLRVCVQKAGKLYHELAVPVAEAKPLCQAPRQSGCLVPDLS
jgi:hypothetical protein